MFWEGNIDGKKVVVFSNVNSLSCMEIKEYTMGTMGMNLLWNEESKIFLTAEELEKRRLVQPLPAIVPQALQQEIA